MTRGQLRQLDRELSEYIESMVEGLGRSERRRALECYLTGLLLDGERKSIEPMAARLVEDEAQVGAMRQRLQQCVSASKWSDGEVRRRLALKLEAQLPGLEALVVDDTGFPKKGKHSVGVARQYSGTLGRTDNCQVAVRLHVAPLKSRRSSSNAPPLTSHARTGRSTRMTSSNASSSATAAPTTQPCKNSKADAVPCMLCTGCWAAASPRSASNWATSVSNRAAVTSMASRAAACAGFDLLPFLLTR